MYSTCLYRNYVFFPLKNQKGLVTFLIEPSMLVKGSTFLERQSIMFSFAEEAKPENKPVISQLADLWNDHPIYKRNNME